MTRNAPSKVGIRLSDEKPPFNRTTSRVAFGTTSAGSDMMGFSLHERVYKFHDVGNEFDVKILVTVVGPIC